VHLPRALGHDRQGELVANASVVDVVVERGPRGAARVDHLVVATKKGRVAVRGREVVLCTGAINTSVLMLRSQSLRDATRDLPIGRRFCANVVSPVLSFYKRDFNVRPTLQLTHYYVPPGRDDGFLLENLFNPPGQSALVMPGYGK